MHGISFDRIATTGDHLCRGYLRHPGVVSEFSPSARAWQDRLLAGEARLPDPSLHYWEFANALRTLVNRGEIQEAWAHEALDLHLTAPLAPAEPDRREVLKTAFEYEATVYDAVFIALALAYEVSW